jgi:phage terminase large subunit
VTKISECIAPSFYDLHRALKEETYNEYLLKGGRGSTKSSFLSIETLLEIMRDPEANAIVFRRFENEIRDTVFGQMQWA